MLTLYHGSTSVCSLKVRIALAERGLAWNSELLDLQRGDQFAPDYLRLNPEAIVPTLLDGDAVIRESSVIIEHLNDLGEVASLSPAGAEKIAQMRLWLLRTISMHEAINSVTFATVIRDAGLAHLSEEEQETRLALIPNPQIRQKRRDIFKNGTSSVFVAGALYTLRRMLADMDEQLGRNGDWLLGEYSLADIAVIAYVDRLERLDFGGMWDEDHPAVRSWLERNKDRPSYAAAVDPWIPADRAEETRRSGRHAWPHLKTQMLTLGL